MEIISARQKGELLRILKDIYCECHDDDASSAVSRLMDEVALWKAVEVLDEGWVSSLGEGYWAFHRIKKDWSRPALLVAAPEEGE